MKEEHKDRIEEILGQMQCPKGFKCAVSGFNDLCKAKDFGNEQYLECLERTTPPCPFALVYDYMLDETHFCKCPLRVYIAKNLRNS